MNLARWKNDMLCHLRDERKRNDLLQARLDQAQAEIARLQRMALEKAPLPAPPKPSRFERFRRKSLARMMAS